MIGDDETVRLSRWSSSREEDQFPVFNPATDRMIVMVQGSGLAEVDGAVLAAKTAFERDWRWRPVNERSHMLHEAARVIRQHAEELAQLTTIQTGMLIGLSRSIDVEECINAFRYFGSAAVTMPNGFVDGGTYHDRIMAEPYGVVAALTPTAWPLLYASAKLAPALVAGNTVVLKPSCASSLPVTRLIELIAPIFPSGVLQLVLGQGTSVGQALVEHPLISKVSFTGDTAVGRAVLHTAADKVMPAIMQLGSRNAIMVFDDADLNLALRAILEGAYSNQGEARTALPRVLLQRRIHERLLSQLTSAVPRLQVGDSMNPATHVGPLSCRERQQLALQQIAAACAAGARIAAQASVPMGEPLCNGYFVPPTVLADVRSDMSIVHEEVFGPVACIMSFNSVDEGIAMANDSRYGLLAVAFTQSTTTATHLSRRLEVGTIYLNNYQCIGYTAMPFNGTKATGYGREEGSLEALREYTRQRVVRVPTQSENNRYWPVVDEILAG
ncbi:MAG: aldehyde dehydrogenase [Steroidobacteraceae bacterium]